jgi:predicted enzyme related to lactoylglutathione lyase
MIGLEVCVDVPDLEQGVRFFADAFGFSKVSEPYPGVAVLKAGDLAITLLAKGEGSQPSPNTSDQRRYARHWTPVHLDFHVDDLKAALERAVTAGATAEQVFDEPGHGSIAFCADPFGHGFCLLQGKPG